MDGFEAALIGYKSASLKIIQSVEIEESQREKEECKKDCELFSKTAKAIDWMLETTWYERENWLGVQDEFEEALRKYK